MQALLDEEQSWGVSELSAYGDFRRRVEALKSDLCDRLYALKSQGARIAAYGASAKGSTLLNYFGIGRDTLEFVVDRSTVKQGHYTPGSHLPIHAPEKLLEEMPDQVLLLTWNFADEIVRQQQEYRRRGGRFLIPIPELRVAKTTPERDTMRLTQTILPGAYVIEPELREDDRGFSAPLGVTRVRVARTGTAPGSMQRFVQPPCRYAPRHALPGRASYGGETGTMHGRRHPRCPARPATFLSNIP